MAGWGSFGSGLAQGFAQGIGPGMRESRWRKRKEEEEERKRQTAIKLFEASTSGSDKDEGLREKGREYIRMGGTMEDARGEYRAALGQKKTKEAGEKKKERSKLEAAAGHELRMRQTRQAAGEELKGRRERRQSGMDQGLTGKALEYYVKEPKTTESELARYPGMPEKPPKAPADPMTKARKQKNAEITNQFNEKNLATRQEFAQQAQQAVGTFDAYLAREYAEDWQMVKQARQTMQAIPPGALSKPLAKYQKAIDDKTSELMGDAGVQAKIKLLQEMPFAPGDDAVSDARAAELRRQNEELKRIIREGEKTIDGLCSGN